MKGAPMTQHSAGAIEARTVPANHVDHIEPHRGKWSLFMQYENTQSLCLHRHNAHRYQERSGSGLGARPALIAKWRFEIIALHSSRVRHAPLSHVAMSAYGTKWTCKLR
jgi:hypothetical protein